MYIFNLFNRHKFLLPTMVLTMTDSEKLKNNMARDMNNLYYSGPLTDDTCFKIKMTLQNMINNNYKDDEINFYLQTNGGSVLATLPLADMIKTSSIPINTYVDGYCASAGTLLSVVGKKRYMTKHSVFLIHSLKIEPGLLDYKSMEDSYINANTIMTEIKDIYKENTNISDYKLEYFLDHDLWINSNECLEYSIVDEII